MGIDCLLSRSSLALPLTLLCFALLAFSSLFLGFEMVWVWAKSARRNDNDDTTELFFSAIIITVQITITTYEACLFLLSFILFFVAFLLSFFRNETTPT